MKKINVGKDFKLPFFGVKGEYIFDKNTGFLFFEEDAIIEKLQLVESNVINLKLDETTVSLKKDNQSDNKFSELELTLSDHKKCLEDLKKQHENKDKIINLLNKKLETVSQEILQMKELFKTVLEIKNETQDSQKQILNILDTEITLKQIWDNYTNKNSAALFCILIMIKKYLEDKGARIL